MWIKSTIALAMLNASIIGTCFAATPDQVGAWEGSVQTTTITTGGAKTKTKSTFKLEIAADDQSTVSLNGTAVALTQGAYNAGDGVLIFGDQTSDPGNVSIGAVHFKGTTIKGTATGAILAVTPEQLLIATISSKFKLKKLP